MVLIEKLSTYVHEIRYWLYFALVVLQNAKLQHLIAAEYLVAGGILNENPDYTTLIQK